MNDMSNPAAPARHNSSDVQTLRVGIGGPVGSGKTALTLSLCRALRGKYNLAVEIGRAHV